MAHDLNTASGGRHTVTAFFDARADAEKARADLKAAGFAEEDITVGPGADAAAAAASHHQQSVLKSLIDIFVFMPPHDQLTYEEGLRRGGAAVAVRTRPEDYERAIDILDRDGAVDLDERETGWRAEGWVPGAAPRPGGPGSREQAGFERGNQHDPLVNPSANQDMRERIGVGTSDMTVGTDLDPPHAASPGGGADRPGLVARDTAHGRKRVRSYVAGGGAVPPSIDPQI